MFLRVDKLQIELPAPEEAGPQRRRGAAGTARRQVRRDVDARQLHVPELQLPQQVQAAAVLQPRRRITAEELGHVELVSNGVAMLANGPDDDERRGGDGGDISDAPFEDMKDIRLAAAFFSNGGGATPVNSNGASLEHRHGHHHRQRGHRPAAQLPPRMRRAPAQAARLRDLTDPTGREVCGYLLVRGSVHAHAYALALKKITGVEIEKMLPTPNIPLGKIPECQKYLDEGSHRRLYTFSPTTTGRWPASGATARWRCPAIRRASSRWSRACPRAARSTS